MIFRVSTEAGFKPTAIVRGTYVKTKKKKRLVTLDSDQAESRKLEAVEYVPVLSEP